MILSPVAWSDFAYKTLYELELHVDGEAHDLGLIKLIHPEGRPQPKPGTYEGLGDGHVSLLQRAKGYAAVEELGLAEPMLAALCELSTLGAETQESLVGLEIIQKTLLRFTAAHHALRYRLRQPRKATEFTITHRVEGFVEPHEVGFQFDGDAVLGRMVALIGPNGAGKTRFLRGLLYPALGIRQERWDDSGLRLEGASPGFSVVIQMSFSAFDAFPLPRGPLSSFTRYCGLRTRRSRWAVGTDVDTAKSFSSLDRAFEELVAKGREDDWRRDMADHGLRVPSGVQLSDWLEHRSAGQKFVGFVLTHLYTTLEPGALLLFDEPEIHSHPGMLTLLMRQLHALLERFDTFAIVATHSPIVIQETPGRQVRVLRRVEGLPLVSRYPTECFGESVDEIIKIGFQLDSPARNFGHHLERLAKTRGVEALEQALPGMGLAARLRLEQLHPQSEDHGEEE